MGLWMLETPAPWHPGMFAASVCRVGTFRRSHVVGSFHVCRKNARSVYWRRVLGASFDIDGGEYMVVGSNYSTRTTKGEVEVNMQTKKGVYFFLNVVKRTALTRRRPSQSSPPAANSVLPIPGSRECRFNRSRGAANAPVRAGQGWAPA